MRPGKTVVLPLAPEMIRNKDSGIQEENSKNWKKLHEKNGVRNKTNESFTTTETNVAHLTSCARARWKIENEHNNVLKNHGYNLEHNFRYGKEHASEMYCLLNLLAFQMHRNLSIPPLLDISDEDYQRARAYSKSRDEFFNELRFLMRFKLFDYWQHFISFMHSPQMTAKLLITVKKQGKSI